MERKVVVYNNYQNSIKKKKNILVILIQIQIFSLKKITNTNIRGTYITKFQFTSSHRGRERRERNPNCKLISEREEDVVDVAGGDAFGSRGGRAYGATHSEGPPERAQFQQGPPLSEPSRSQHDRLHYLHHR
jgi:hypothetical protein